MDAVPEQLDAPAGHVGVVAAHAAQRHGEGQRVLDVVKADDAEVPGPDVPVLLHGVQRVPRLHVAEYEQPVEAVPLQRQQLLRGNQAVLRKPPRRGGPVRQHADPAVRFGDARLVAGPLKALYALRAGEHHRAAGHVGQPPQAVRHQMQRGQIGSLGLVAYHAVGLAGVQMTGHQHEGRACAAQKLDRGLAAGGGEQQHALHPPGDGLLRQLVFLIGVVPAAHDHQRVARLLGRVLNGVRHDAVKGVGHVAQDHREDPRAPRAQGAGQLVRRIAHPPRHFLDRLAGLRGDVFLISKRVRYRIHRIARLPGDVLQRHAPIRVLSH